ncbi:MAG TPA: chemotaxis protein CheC [Verrucomicrobiae bacterium]|nr:chemotaxis protein CheC [Verrucomicrobiae bacterium]
MELTATHEEALTELINIGYGRAAAALSELTGRRIILEVPKVAVFPIDKVSLVLSQVLQGEVASVHQVFSGPVAGHALLLLDHEAAMLLNSLLLDQAPTGRLDASAREALIEVGNIVLNACLGVFGNLLQVQVTFAVPRLHMESVGGVLNSISVHEEELQYALMVHTRFHLKDSDVSGYMVIVLGIASFSRLLSELEKWEKRQVSR